MLSVSCVASFDQCPCSGKEGKDGIIAVLTVGFDCWVQQQALDYLARDTSWKAMHACTEFLHEGPMEPI